jgi:predicted dehydrogenase
MEHVNTRRTFLKAAAAGSVLITSPLRADEEVSAEASTQPDTDTVPRRVVVGVMGLNRGLALAKAFSREPHVELRYLCDVDSARCATARNELARDTGQESSIVGDFRYILNDPEVDVLVCAAPNHWHGPATILACDAGKHVYVEKPASHNPYEGELMVAAARKHNRIVQVGMQRRSNPAWIDVIDRIHQGEIGTAYLARCWYANTRGSVGQDEFTEVPPELDYELWQGPAPRKPYSPAVVHYNWHWRWHWGNGELGNNGIHTLDLCRWGLNAEFPSRVASLGGRYAFDDAQETPDTQTVSYEFGTTKSISWQGTSSNRHTPGFVTFYGTDGTIEVDENGTNRHFDHHGKLVREEQSSSGSLREHIANFLESVRGEDQRHLNADIEVGHRSTLMCHLGNIAHRVGQTLKCDSETGSILEASEAMEYWRREYAAGWEPTV